MSAARRPFRETKTPPAPAEFFQAVRPRRFETKAGGIAPAVFPLPRPAFPDFMGALMPHLRFRGFDEAILEQYLPTLLPSLASLISCPEDWITVESVPTRFLTQPATPMVEVVWFAREQSVQDAVARALHEAALTWVHPPPVVIFTPVATANYYENGKNFVG